MKIYTQCLCNFAVAAVVGMAFVSCGSMENYAAKRREQLLADYDLGKTTRAEIDGRWKHADLRGVRPTNGWVAFAPKFVGDRMRASEQRTGRAVYGFDRYMVPDGWSGGLCNLWFYYDEQDKLVDADWEYHTD